MAIGPAKIMTINKIKRIRKEIMIRSKSEVLFLIPLHAIKVKIAIIQVIDVPTFWLNIPKLLLKKINNIGNTPYIHSISFKGNLPL